MPPRRKFALGPLETQVMALAWKRRTVTAEEVRQSLAPKQQLKESTVRTVLRRLEAKGYLRHRVDGRTYVYEPRIDAQRAASDAVQGIINRFCGGSVEALLVGMVDNRLLTPDELADLAKRIRAAEAREKLRPPSES